MSVDPRAFVHPSVEIDPSNDIGPHVTIEEGVTLGKRNRLYPNAFLGTGTILGDDNVIHMSAVVGHVPQDLAYEGQPTVMRVGNRNIIREFATIHRGAKTDTETVIGDDCFIMTSCDIGHNCRLGDGVIIATGALLGGYVEIGDRAFISASCVAHQFTRIGELVMMSGLSGITSDAPPFMIVSGRPGVVIGINAIGLRRAGIDADVRNRLKEAYRIVFRSGRLISEATAELEDDPVPEVRRLVEFIRASKRGILAGGSGK